MILQKKIDKKIRFEILKSIVREFTYFNKFISTINNLYVFPPCDIRNDSHRVPHIGSQLKVPGKGPGSRFCL